MRYILLIMTVAIIYIVIARSGSITPASKAITESMEAANPQASAGASASPHTDAFKAPLDRVMRASSQSGTTASTQSFRPTSSFSMRIVLFLGISPTERFVGMIYHDRYTT